MTSNVEAPSAAQLVEEARRAAAAGSNDRAVALLNSALEAQPDDPAILNMLANRLMAAGDADTAVTHLKRAIERKVAFVPGASFHPNGGGANTMRLNFSYCAPDIIREGITRLGFTLKEALQKNGQKAI